MAKNKSKDELLDELSAVCFVVQDIKLFLDTHPCDKDMISMYREYVAQSKQLKQQYEAFYGPLVAETYEPEEKWRWIDDPWPWECSKEG